MEVNTQPFYLARDQLLAVAAPANPFRNHYGKPLSALGTRVFQEMLHAASLLSYPYRVLRLYHKLLEKRNGMAVLLTAANPTH